MSEYMDAQMQARYQAAEDKFAFLENEIVTLRADLEAAKRERDEQTARADDLLDTLGKTVEKIGYTEEVARDAEAATDSKLVSDGIKWWFDQKSTDRDALAAQVEERTRALEKVAALINESTGVTGLHLSGEVAPWCDLMTGGKYEEWLCGVFESLQLDAPTALRERLEAETKPLVEALECAAKVAIGDDELHIEGCPEDDTCHCKNAQTINRGMAIVAATKARLEGGSR